MGITAHIIDSNKKTGSENMNRKYEGSFASEHDGLFVSVLGVLPQEKPYRAVVHSLYMEWRSIRNDIYRLWSIWQTMDMWQSFTTTEVTEKV